MITIDGVSVRRGRTVVLAGLDLRIGPGLTVVTGPNGSGKTTLLRLLATSLRPSAGKIRINGLDPVDPVQRRRVRERLGYLPQDIDTDSREPIGTLLDQIAFLKGLTDPDDRVRAIGRLAVRHGLVGHLSARVSDVTPGMLRRALIAQALIGDPQLVVLDEPFTHIDTYYRRLLHSVLDEQRERRAT
ncbi:MAG: ATP-binding cassette domain-containing protein, partial [Acidimicrobiia bacterium]